MLVLGVRPITKNQSPITKNLYFYTMPQLSLDFKTKLNYKNLDTYDITELDVAVTVESESVFSIKNVTFRVILQELDAISYLDEDIEVYQDILMLQQTHLDEQLSVPFDVISEKTFDCKLQIYGMSSHTHNFLDIIKSVPDYLATKQPKFEVFIECIVNAKTDTECSAYQIYPIDNPFCKITDNFRKWRLD
jgi:hypothetical protein